MKENCMTKEVLEKNEKPLKLRSVFKNGHYLGFGIFTEAEILKYELEGYVFGN